MTGTLSCRSSRDIPNKTGRKTLLRLFYCFLGGTLSLLEHLPARVLTTLWTPFSCRLRRFLFLQKKSRIASVPQYMGSIYAAAFLLICPFIFLRYPSAGGQQVRQICYCARSSIRINVVSNAFTWPSPSISAAVNCS